MLTARRLFLGLALAGLTIVSYGRAQSYDGTWSGMTGQSKAISLEVSGGSIRKFILAARVEAVGCSSNISETINTTVAVGSNGAFSYQSGTGVPISWTISGSLSTSANTASGSLAVRVNLIPVPGACLGSANTTWNATRSGTPGPDPGPGPAPTGSWISKTSGVTSSLGGVDFADDLLGLVSGGTATLLRTVDGGTTWNRINLGNVATDRCCYNVRFASRNVVWVVGIRAVLRSTDGGQTFGGAQYTDAPFRTSIFPISETEAWAVGGSSGARIHYRYAMSGTSMTSQFWSVPSSDFMRDIFFVNANTGWSVGSPGRIIKITNGTGTPQFTIQQSGTTVMLHGIFMLDENRGWTVGDGGTILSTTNGGASWSPQSSGTTNALQKVAFRDALSGIIVGDAGIILTTSDGGATWRIDPSGTSNNLRHISFENAAHAVGANGTILQKSISQRRRRGARRAQ